MDALIRKRGELEAGIAAIRSTMIEGVQLETAVRQCRSDVDTAMVELGQRDAPMGRISGPNQMSAFIERSTALSAIYRGQPI
jgi:hypothetical protein